MKTGIEKFKDVINPDLCDSLINFMDLNLPNSLNKTHSNLQNVICREIILPPNSEFDAAVYEVIAKVAVLYKEKYCQVAFSGDTGYQLRKITGETRLHVDNISKNYRRNISIILGLNSNYKGGEFHFPEQDFSTTVKRGEAIVFPVYFLYPHSVDAPIGNRYTINTWMIDADTSFQ